MKVMIVVPAMVQSTTTNGTKHTSTSPGLGFRA